MDSLSITAIIAGVGALIVSILTHIKHSKCFCVDLTTTQSTSPIPTTIKTFNQLNNESKTEEHTITESRPPTPTPIPNILIQQSKPIPIPSTPLLKNYL